MSTVALDQRRVRHDGKLEGEARAG